MLAQRTALVTGSTSGIGLGIARALAGQGCRLMLHGLAPADDAAQLRASLSAEFGVEVRFDPADLRQPSAVEDLIRTTQEQLGSVDILVNNAGRQHTAPVEDFPVEMWDELLAVNLSAAFHATRTALPAMRQSGWGRVINIASVHGLVASVHKAAYVATKHALVGLTKVVALETAGSGVTVNAICPGFTRTGLIEQQLADRAARLSATLEEAERDLLAEKQPTGTFVTVEQLGAVAVFLCSPAANQMTGSSLPIDGGWTAQ